MHREVITHTADGFEFSPPLTHPEVERYMATMMQQRNDVKNMWCVKVYESQELAEMGCSGRGYGEV